MSRFFSYTLFMLLTFFPAAFSQLPHGGRPYPTSRQKSVMLPVIMPRFDSKAALSESLSDDALAGKKPLRFAWNHPLDLNPSNSGQWAEMPDGRRVWRIHLISYDAYAVNVEFSRYQLNPGAMVFIYPPSQDFFFGGFNYENNNKSSILPTSFVSGEELIVELQVKQGISDYGILQIGSMAHAYLDIFGKKDNYFGQSGACNVDVNCKEGEDWQIVKKAVCRIIINSSTLCTGALINNVRMDSIPYVLTANHCISTSYKASSTLFLFNHEVDTCSKTVVSNSYSLAGSSLLATSDSIDFSLVLLSETPPDIYKPYYAGWSISSTPAIGTVCIHHPEGDVKKISIDEDALTSTYQSPIPSDLDWLYNESIPGAFWRVLRWETGTTEGGSSGSPLFNQNKQIVGNLTGGQANCSNSVNDYFSKFHVGWNHYPAYAKQLKHWLDPDNTGVTSLNGFDPFGETDTSKIEYSTRYNLFPNPASNFVTFETDSLDISGGQLSVYSITGKKIAHFMITETQRLTFDISFLSQGIYIIEFRKGSEIERKRLFVLNPQKL